MNLTSAYEAQKQDLEDCIGGGDYDGVVERFSIRSSGFLTAVAHALRFQNHVDYEKAVRTRLGDNPQLLEKLQATTGNYQPDGSPQSKERCKAFAARQTFRRC